MKLSLELAKVMTTGRGDDTGCLVYVDGCLAAVLVRLDDEFYESDRGCWNLEAGFGPCDILSRAPFPALSKAVDWIATTVGVSLSSAAEAVSALALDDVAHPA